MEYPARNLVVVGLAARNEEANIYNSLESIREALLYLNRSGVKVVVCANGCTDNTHQEVERFMERHKDTDVDLVHSDEGLVVAQRFIVTNYPADIYVFPDADNVIHRESIKLLLDALAEPSVVVAYARTSPEEDPESRSLFQSMGILYDSQKLLTERRYFHGRLFATKDWYMPESAEIIRRARRTRMGAALLRYSRPGTFLYADDIFMSSYIMDKYGLESIRQVKEAICFSKSVGSLRDWWNSYRRRNVEMAKLHYWFPEYDYLAPHINRRTDWAKWRRSTSLEKTVWLGLLLLKGLFWIRLKIELAAVFLGVWKPSDQWQATLTTKRWKKH